MKMSEHHHEAEAVVHGLMSMMKVSEDKEEAVLMKEIELMLQSINDFVEMVDMIRSDTNLCITTTLPLVVSKAMQLEGVFAKVDELEKFVEMVQTTLIHLEEQVGQAEIHYSTISSLKHRVLGTLSSIGKKSHEPGARVQEANEQSTQYVPIDIFRTDDIFRRHQPELTEKPAEHTKDCC